MSTREKNHEAIAAADKVRYYGEWIDGSHIADSGKTTLLERIQELEVQCAAMREALDAILENDALPRDHVVAIASHALSTDAGKALLERLRDQENLRCNAEAILHIKEKQVDYLKDKLHKVLDALDE